MISTFHGERCESLPDRVMSRDGTRGRTWTNSADGVPLVVSSGLGTPPVGVARAGRGRLRVHGRVLVAPRARRLPAPG
jgi:hypothetical protein